MKKKKISTTNMRRITADKAEIRRMLGLRNGGNWATVANNSIFNKGSK